MIQYDYNEEDQNNPAVLMEVDDQSEIYNQHVGNSEQNEGNLSDLEDIFEPKRKEDNEGDQDNLTQFLDGIDDDELENFL